MSKTTMQKFLLNHDTSQLSCINCTIVLGDANLEKKIGLYLCKYAISQSGSNLQLSLLSLSIVKSCSLLMKPLWANSEVTGFIGDNGLEMKPLVIGGDWLLWR
jgi:hypothetical protein